MEQFTQLLNFCKKNIQSLYILGDLFEAWLGDDDPSDFCKTVTTLLRDCSDAGTAIYLLRGNRDFLMGAAFASAIGATLLADPTRITLQGKPVLISHGDKLCTDDTAYQRYRRIIQNPMTRWMLGHLPLPYRQSLAKKLRDKSRSHQQQASMQIMDINANALQTWFNRYQCQMIIHGHTHRPSIHWLRGKDAVWYQHYVLSDWHETGNALLFTEDSAPQLIHFTTTPFSS